MTLTTQDQRTSDYPPILIIGLGNPILGDDGIGWKVAEQLAVKLSGSSSPRMAEDTSTVPSFHSDVEVDCLSIGGLGLMERIIDYEQVILIDAFSTGKSPAGTVSLSRLSDLPPGALGHLASAHDTTLQNAIEVGRLMGAKLPEEILVVGIEAQEVFDFSMELSPAVLEAIPKAETIILELLK